MIGLACFFASVLANFLWTNLLCNWTVVLDAEQEQRPRIPQEAWAAALVAPFLSSNSWHRL
jgi:hypothetical protein